MRFDFYSLIDQKGDKIADCFKSENTSYCDSPRNGAGLDVIKTESSSADLRRDIYYKVRDRHVQKGVTTEITYQSKLWKHAHYQVNVEINLKRIQESQKFFSDTQNESQYHLTLLREIIAATREWVRTENQSSNIYTFNAPSIVYSFDTQKWTRQDESIKVIITIPKSGNFGSEDFPVAIQIGEKEYRYQYQNLSKEMQQQLIPFQRNVLTQI